MTGIAELKKTIAERLIRLRLEHGWTQAEVARRARMTRDFISKSERAEREISLFTLCKLATVFKVDVRHFLSPGSDERHAAVTDLQTLVTGLGEAEAKWVAGMVRHLLAHPLPGGAASRELEGRTTRRRTLSSKGSKK